MNILTKKTFSCCEGRGDRREVKSFGKENIIIRGIGFISVVLQTCIDLKEPGIRLY